MPTSPMPILPAAPGLPSGPRRRFSRGLLWAGLGLALVLVIALTVAFVLRESSPQFSARLAAQAAPKQLELPDGSTIAADPDTDLGVAFFSRRRQVVLTRGRAFFHVKWQPRAAFLVETTGPNASNAVEIEGERSAIPDALFTVRVDGPLLAVQVRSGSVKVRTVTAGAREYVELKAGDSLVVDMAARRHELGKVDPAAVSFASPLDAGLKKDSTA